MAGLVRDYARELSLVAHAQQQAGEDDREARRKHHRVELGNTRQIDAEILSRWAADRSDEVLEIGRDPGVADQEVGP